MTITANAIADVTTDAAPNRLRRSPQPASPGARLGWILYAPGNETVNVLLLYFIMAPYLTNVVVGDGVAGQTLWGWISAGGAIVVALGGQILGSATDIIGGQKRFIAGFVALAAAGAAALWFATPGADTAALVAIGIAVLAVMIGTEMAALLYNSLLPKLAAHDLVGRTSGTSIATGIFWGLGVLGCYIVAFMVPAEPLFGLDKALHEHDRIAGPVSAAALLLFVLPLLILTPATPIRRVCLPVRRMTLGVLGETYRAMRAHPRIARFVIARMIYQDGIGVALAFGSIYAAGHFGWDGLELGVFGMAVLGSSAIGAFIGGKVDDRIGAKLTIAISLVILLVGISSLIAVPAPAVSGIGFLATFEERLFIVMACLMGVSIGPAQGSGRSMMARLAPSEDVGRWFGIMALTGNAIAFTGPLLLALVTDATDSQRLGLLVSPALILVGLMILLGVKRDDPARTRETT